MVIPKEHIEDIRVRKFSIGGEENPLTEDLCRAVKHLSSELYTKDIHFIMELIQNAEDNEYPPNVQPSLEFVFTIKDITGTGAPGTHLVFNNEKGFSKDNIKSLCSVGRSAKRGNQQGGGYLGEKGIGFKSVFLVTSQPYIISGGYKIRFNEVPSPGTKIGYIVPEWVENPSMEDIRQVYYGNGDNAHELPNTIIALPLREEKVDAVKNEVSNIHPEAILFMSKIKNLSVREDSQNSSSNKVTSVSVSLEKQLQAVNNDESESFILHLEAQENDDWKSECSYHMWRQRFPVKNGCQVEQRKDLQTIVITLAFPREERVTRKKFYKRQRVKGGNRVGGDRIAAGIYAFLPTEVVTGFPFIIQADFMLVSSRESVIWDNEWNKGILYCIPSAFRQAFMWLLQSSPVSSKSCCLKYLPINIPSHPQLKPLQNAIQMELLTDQVIFTERSTHCRPARAVNILAEFRTILEKATEQPTYLQLSRVSIVHSCMDDSRVLEFLGVRNADTEFYAHCVMTTSWARSWVARLSEDLYVQLLSFLSKIWEPSISSRLEGFPLFKFDLPPNGVGWASLKDTCNDCRIYFSSEGHDIEWLKRWNSEFAKEVDCKFIPNSTQKAMMQSSDWPQLQIWLRMCPNITDLSVSSFTKRLVEHAQISKSAEFVVHVTHFLRYSSSNQYIDTAEVDSLCSQMPTVDSGSIGIYLRK